jgi:hypothetical protein
MIGLRFEGEEVVYLAGKNEKEHAWMVVTGALGGASRHAQAGAGWQRAEPAGSGAQPGAHRELGH